MSKPTSRSKAFSWPLALLFLTLGSGYLLLKNLDSATLWDDEAEVAIFARNLATLGKLTAYDGRNLFAFSQGATLTEDLQSRQPPLMFWLTALSFKVFGVSTFTARLPFALCGLLTVLLLYFILARELPHAPLAAPLGACSLATSVSFLLYARLCRYPALVMLLALLAYYALGAFRTRPTGRSASLLITAGVLFFFSHYLLAVAFVGLLLAESFLSHGLWLRARHWRAAALPASAGLLAVLAYSYAFKIWQRPDMIRSLVPVSTLKRTLHFAGYYSLAPLYLHSIPLLLLVAWGAWRALQWRGKAALQPWRPQLTYAGLAFGNCLLLGLITPQAYGAAPFPDTRYVVAALPFGAAWMGSVLAQSAPRLGAVGAFVVLLLLQASNLVGLPEGKVAARIPLAKHNQLAAANGGYRASSYGYRWLLPAFLKEIHAPYSTPAAVAIAYLERHAAFDDCVVATPNHQTWPLLFYLGDRVRFCCVLQPNSPLLRSPQLPPQANVQCKQPPQHLLYFERLAAPLRISIEQAGFTVTHLESFGYDTHKPELFLHHFSPVEDYDRREEGVFVARRLARGR